MLTQDQLLAALPHAINGVQLPRFGPCHAGKVRDSYRGGDRMIIITTDRVSAFDRVMGVVPYKGQVLNQLSAWWFAQTEDIIPNHLLEVPDPNVMLVKTATPLPIEVIVRGYITGVTSTALWTLYTRGERQPYGVELPDGLQQNDPLPKPIITPTTKATDGGHDERVTRAELLKRGLVTPDVWARVEMAALALFERGQQQARAAGLILVDTKYEFGLYDGQLLLIDELHTPDSSRYWLHDSYEEDPDHPEHLDKEYLRRWYVDQGYRGEGEPPRMPPTVIAEMAARYIVAYERLTARPFMPGDQPAAERIVHRIEERYFGQTR